MNRFGVQIVAALVAAPFIRRLACFRLERGDDAVVMAESLGELRPLELEHD
jgi:hypothetical protein